MTEESIKLIKKIYDDQATNDELLKTTGTALADKINNVFSEMNSPFDVPDVAMLTRLTSDVWSFSAAKNWRELHDLTQAILDDKGFIRPFNEYKKIAEEITHKYNDTWLKTEYNQAIASSQNAARWVEFEKDGIKFLRYQTAGDKHVRTEHQLIDGTVKELKDDWWNTHYPPNGWSCRCEAVQAPEATKPSQNTPTISIPGMFKTNLAKTGLIFPKNHPYYDGVPRSVIRKSILHLPPKNTYMDVMLGDYPIQIHPLHGHSEIDETLTALKTLLIHEKGNIKVLPIIEEKDMVAKKRFYPEKYLKKFSAKSADIQFNGVITEIERSSGNKNSIHNRIRSGKSQADNIVIIIPDNIKIKDIDRHINGQMKWYKDKEDLNVWIYNKNEIKKYQTKKKE